MNYRIEPYQHTMQQSWDQLVLQNSANGTLFHTRNFLSYHPKERFEDASILIYKEEKLICVLGACKTKQGYFSHSGTSCGGPVYLKDHYVAHEVHQTLQLIQEYYQNKLTIRICESSLTEKGNDLILYFLQKTHTLLPELSAQIALPVHSPIDCIRSSETRRKVRKIFKENFLFQTATNEKEYETFHILLSKNLEKHNTTPVHTVKELLELRTLLGEKQQLVLAVDPKANIHAGVWLIQSNDRVWHAQYIVKNYESSCHNIVEALITSVVNKLQQLNTSILNLGISTENQGTCLNSNLIRFKEKFTHQHENRYIAIPKKNPENIQLK